MNKDQISDYKDDPRQHVEIGEVRYSLTDASVVSAITVAPASSLSVREGRRDDYPMPSMSNLCHALSALSA
jgi:hypothetical protein